MSAADAQRQDGDIQVRPGRRQSRRHRHCHGETAVSTVMQPFRFKVNNGSYKSASLKFDLIDIFEINLKHTIL